jgi:transcriptional regulator with XRE-family HTH domain
VSVESNLAEGVFTGDRLNKDERRCSGATVTAGDGVGQTGPGERFDPKAAHAELRARLETARLKKRLSKKQLSGQAILGRTTVSNAFNSCTQVPSAETVTALARVLGMEVGPLLVLRDKAAGTPPNVSRTPTDPAGGSEQPGTTGTSSTEPDGVAGLLRALHDAGQEQPAAELAHRASLGPW